MSFSQNAAVIVGAAALSALSGAAGWFAAKAHSKHVAAMNVAMAAAHEAVNTTDGSKSKGKDDSSATQVAHAEFLKAYDALTATKSIIAYNPEWKNGTGYFNGCVQMCTPETVGVGRYAAFCTDSNRRMIIDVSPVGTTVVFERYSPGGSKVLVCNKTHGMRPFSSGSLSVEDIKSFLDGSYLHAEVN